MEAVDDVLGVCGRSPNVFWESEILLWDFPDPPVVKTLCFHCWGNELNPWLGN